MAAPTESDFINSVLADHGVSVTRTPVTKTTDNLTGDIIRTEGTPATITMVFKNPTYTYDWQNVGEEKGTITEAFVKGSQTINKEDKLTWNSLNFRVKAVNIRYFDGNAIYKKIDLILI